MCSAYEFDVLNYARTQEMKLCINPYSSQNLERGKGGVSFYALDYELTWKKIPISVLAESKTVTMWTILIVHLFWPIRKGKCRTNS